MLPDTPGLKKRHKQLLEYIRDSWLLLGIAMGCMMVVAGTTAATAFLVKPVLDEIFMQKNTAMLILLPVVVMVLYVCRGIAMYGQEYLMKYVGERIIKR
ncbi:MAG: ABC transporter transmembrane domain-containing protein, partial [Thermodesulfobacteriota bacterium]